MRLATLNFYFDRQASDELVQNHSQFLGSENGCGRFKKICVSDTECHNCVRLSSMLLPHLLKNIISM